jgi:hypothetical protein
MIDFQMALSEPNKKLHKLTLITIVFLWLGKKRKMLVGVLS